MAQKKSVIVQPDWTSLHVAFVTQNPTNVGGYGYGSVDGKVSCEVHEDVTEGLKFEDFCVF